MVSKNIHKILITLLFKNKEEIEKKINFKKVNYDDIIKLASSHLMIPALYIRLRENKLLKIINNDFKEYLKYIYDLNKIRNKSLIEELRELSDLYIENEIDHVFLKGSAYIAYGRFNDIGERMVGDIDVLVAKSDYNKSIKLSKKHGYNSNATFIFDSKHYPRMIHPKKIFALEIHNKLLRNKNKLLKPESFLKNKIKIESSIYVPNKMDRILHTIYNYQINDLGNFNATISYRSLYDIAVYKSEINDLLKSKYSKYLNNYFLISDYIGITNTNVKLNILNTIYLFRFKAKRKYKMYNILDNIICRQIYATPIRINNFYRLFTSSKYRLYLLNKINRKLN